ncbi:MAG: glycosyltransferase 61 family protein [Microcoleaceae cyanobacterium]
MEIKKFNSELLFKITGGYKQLEILDIEIKNKSENYFRKARQLQHQGQLEEAIATYQQVIKLNPDFYQAYINLGEILSEQGILDEAISCYRRALELKPNDIDCYRNLQQLLINYYRSFDNSPKTVEDYCSLGRNLISQKKWEDAIACFLLALQIKPSYRDAYQQIGNILQQQGLNNFAHPCYHGKLPHYLLTRLNLCEKTRNWEVTSTSEINNDVIHISIYPASTGNLLPPNTINTNIHPNFKNQNHSLETFVAIVPNGRAWGDNSNSAVITSENQLLSDISTGNPEIIMSSKSLPPIHYIDGKVVFISGLTAVQNYYHWMIDVLPRIELLRHSEIDFNSIDKFVFNRHGASYHKETLDYLGISQNKVIHTWQYPHIKATELVVPSAPFRSSSPKEIRIPKWVCKFLKKKFLEENLATLPKASKRIYISRGSSSRKIVNEEQFMQVLGRLSFELVTFESMSVFEQAALIAEAEIVVAPHGAGLANLVFCSPGTKVIELFSPSYVNVCYWILSNQCNLEYYYLMGENRVNSGEENLSPGINPTMSSQDIWVNIDSFLDLIKASKIKI